MYKSVSAQIKLIEARLKRCDADEASHTLYWWPEEPLTSGGCECQQASGRWNTIMGEKSSKNC